MGIAVVITLLSAFALGAFGGHTTGVEEGEAKMVNDLCNETQYEFCELKSVTYNYVLKGKDNENDRN